MQLSEATLEHLKDEAYVTLCRDAVQENLAALEREKETIADTRPPFGLLARKETRDAFTRSMRTALDSEAALHERLAQIVGIEARLRPVLQKDIAAYLAGASPEFARFRQIRARLADWEQAFLALPDMLVAFARDLRLARGATVAPDAAREFGHELAVLRDSAERLERRHNELLVIAGAIAELLATGPADGIGAPALPDFRRVAWVSRLAVLPLEQAVPEVARLETDVRAFLAGGGEPALARLAASRDACLQFESQLVESYWAQLRVHALAHYVEARDLDEVLESLAQRYISADLARRQRALTANPFLVAH